MMMDIKNYICFSGAAQGADTVWEEECMKYGVKVVAFSFPGHSSKSKNKKIIVPELLIKGDVYLLEVNKILKRRYPTKNNYANNLIRRDVYQSMNSDGVFAISTIENGLCCGGTGWCVHLSILLKKKVYVFEQKLEQWFTWDYDKEEFKECIEPKLVEKFAGIGTRNINSEGVKAIKSLMEKTFKNI